MRNNYWRGLAMGAMLALFAASATEGDVLTLKNGGTLEGEVTEAEKGFTLVTAQATVTFAKSEVAGVQYGPSANDTYLQRASKTGATDAQGWYELGVFCREAGLVAEAEDCFNRALAADADHEGAREGLGYVFEGGRWISRDEAMAAKGLVNYGGRYVTVEEADKLEAAELDRTRARRAHARMRTLKFMISHSTRGKRRESREKLAGMSDPAAFDALVEAARHPDAAVRNAVVSAMQNYAEDEAALLALELAIWDSDDAVRRQAVSVLSRKQNEAAFQAAVGALSTDDDMTRFRVSTVLGGLGDLRAIPYLIDYLTWTRPRIPADKPAPARRWNPPTARFVVGLRSKVAKNAVARGPVIREWRNGRLTVRDDYYEDEWENFPAVANDPVLNYEALSALTALTGKDFRFDREAWRNWYLANARLLQPLPAGAP